MDPDLQSYRSTVREGYVSVANARLAYRQVGQGEPVILLHGGPDFNYDYLLPEMDLLSDAFLLIYYDQRGRGRSAGDISPEEVSMQSEVADLEALRKHFQLESSALLGHSWGGLLALEYALQHPERVSHLILLNPAPVSHADWMLLRKDRRARAAGDLEKMKAIASTASYIQGDIETEAEYYRLHFRMTLRQPEQLERVVKSLRLGFTKESILKAREIEKRLYEQTWLSSEYNLLPRLKQLGIPTLVIHGAFDLIPAVCAAHIAEAIPEARFILLRETGHFSYLESPHQVHKEIVDFYFGVLAS